MAPFYCYLERQLDGAPSTTRFLRASRPGARAYARRSSEAHLGLRLAPVALRTIAAAIAPRSREGLAVRRNSEPVKAVRAERIWRTCVNHCRAISHTPNDALQRETLERWTVRPAAPAYTLYGQRPFIPRWTTIHFPRVSTCLVQYDS